MRNVLRKPKTNMSTLCHILTHISVPSAHTHNALDKKLELSQLFYNVYVSEHRSVLYMHTKCLYAEWTKYSPRKTKKKNLYHNLFFLVSPCVCVCDSYTHTTSIHKAECHAIRFIVFSKVEHSKIRNCNKKSFLYNFYIYLMFVLYNHLYHIDMEYMYDDTFSLKKYR